ncbi:trigger factor, partial [Candidatus Liberibacter sp.]|uniref:trigger factor n=1 Tax=Candidatus Liberibacter sp. TaxID=34022 RepID=UPI001852A0ED|nr:trigger factor [Candidatus Liberibacter sp.]
DNKTVEVLFPEDHSIKDLAGKTVVFEFAIKEIASPLPVIIDDALAVRLGFESESVMRDLLSKQINQRVEIVIRQKIKRQVLDYLDQKYKFDVPPSLVKNEYDNIIQQLKSDLNSSGKGEKDQLSVAEEDQDYRKLAERRVRLGIVIGTIGENEGIQVTEDEMKSALYQHLRQFPGNEKEIIEYFRKSPDAATSVLRAPLFEEKTIDYLLTKVSITDKKVMADQLLSHSDELA